MPRYFFDISVGAQHARDEFGIELANSEVAREQANAVMPQIMSETPDVEDADGVTLTVRDEDGSLVFEGRASIVSRASPAF